MRLGLRVLVVAGLSLTLFASLAQDRGAAATGASAASAASQPARLALVIGNADYAGSRLDNPVNDARDIAGLLRQVGFEVILRENLGLREMHLALREFGGRLKRESLGLFYFAGHGVQVRGRNYLVPIGADIDREDEVAFNALDLQAVLEKMDSARNHTNLVILDACRNNPFAARFKLANNGLAQIDAPPGTMVAFATAPGAVASDGKGRNGLYTKSLLAHLASPGTRIEEAFKQVRSAVRQESKGLQTPWESTSLESELLLKPVPTAPAARAITPAPSKVGATPGPVGAAPRFEVGDRWAWRITNQLSGEVRSVRRRIVSIQDEAVSYDNGMVRDRSGNTLREVVAGRQRSFTPSSLHFVFPLTPGLTWGGKPIERGEDYVTDLDATVKVLAEEEIDTPIGRVMTVKVERSVAWKNRNSGRSGVARSTYWYASRFKSSIRMEWSNTTSEGRVFIKELQELEGFGNP